MRERAGRGGCHGDGVQNVNQRVISRRALSPADHDGTDGEAAAMSLQPHGPGDLLPLRARLFEPGQRLGWIFRDRLQFAAAFPEPPPPRLPVPPHLVAAQQAARQRFRRSLRISVVAGVAVILLIALVAAVGDAFPGSVPRGAAVAVVVAVVLAGLAFTGSMAAGRGAATRAVQQAQRDLAMSYQQQAAAWAGRKAAFERADSARVGGLAEWGAARPPAGTRRIDVFGGSLHGWEAFLTVYGTSVLAERPALVADFSRELVCRELALLAQAAGAPADVQVLPAQLAESSVLTGLPGQQVAAALVEAMHPGDTHAAGPQRSIDGRILGEICGVLGGQVTLARLAAALRVLMGGQDKSGLLSPHERTQITGELFTAEYLRQVQPDLVRIESYLHPVAGLGSAGAPRDPAYLTCIALQPGASNVRDELLAALVVQWITHHISSASAQVPAVIIAGADDLGRRHLERLSDACERRGVALTLLFRHLREASAELIGGGAAGFMRLGNHQEAARAADFIGRQHRFVLSEVTVSLGGEQTHTTETGQSHGVTEGESGTIKVGGAPGWLTGLGGAGLAGLGGTGLAGLRQAGGPTRTASRTWSAAYSRAVATNWSNAESGKRVYEYAVEPTTLQHLPDYAMLLVSSRPGGGHWLAPVECNPEIVTLPRVSMDPLPNLARPAQHTQPAPYPGNLAGPPPRYAPRP
jgi:hypothetical protein